MWQDSFSISPLFSYLSIFFFFLFWITVAAFIAVCAAHLLHLHLHRVTLMLDLNLLVHPTDIYWQPEPDMNRTLKHTVWQMDTP